jgi:hypothetical protein
MGEVLATALATVREGCAQTERSVTEGRLGAETLMKMLRTTGRTLAEEFTLGHTLTAIADGLDGLDGPDMPPLTDAADAVLRELLPRIARSYTMASERVIHDAFLLPDMDPVSVAAPAAGGGLDDEDDDGLF